MDKEKKAKISLYKKNTSSYILLLFAVLFEMIYTIVTLNNMTTNYKMGVVILINIVLIFLMFSCAVKVKIYIKKSIYICGCISIYVIVRYLLLIPYFVQPKGQLMTIRISSILTFILCLTATIISYKVTVRREHILKQEQ